MIINAINDKIWYYMILYEIIDNSWEYMSKHDNGGILCLNTGFWDLKDKTWHKQIVLELHDIILHKVPITVTHDNTWD